MVGRSQSRCLGSTSTALAYDAGDTFDQSAAEGFIKIFGLPVEIRPQSAVGQSSSGSQPSIGSKK